MLTRKKKEEALLGVFIKDIKSRQISEIDKFSSVQTRIAGLSLEEGNTTAENVEDGEGKCRSSVILTQYLGTSNVHSVSFFQGNLGSTHGFSSSMARAY